MPAQLITIDCPDVRINGATVNPNEIFNVVEVNKPRVINPNLFNFDRSFFLLLLGTHDDRIFLWKVSERSVLE